MKVRLVYDIDPDIVAKLKAKTEKEFLEGTLSPKKQELLDITIMICNNPSFIDDKNENISPISRFVCVGVPAHKRVYICPVESDHMCNLRPFYIENNRLHLSTRVLPGLYFNGKFMGEGDVITETWV